MNIRSITVQDVPAIAELFTASVHEIACRSYNAAQLQAWAPEPPSISLWQSRLSSLDTLIAEDGDALCGFIAFEHNGHIEFLYTAPAYGRRGVASALYFEAVAVLRRLGVEKCYAQASLEARPFFENKGFRVVAEEEVMVKGVQFRRFAVARSLSS